MSDSRVTGTLSATGQTAACHGRKIDIILTGTWVGTVALQRKVDASTWLDCGEAWTANDAYVVDGVTPGDYRLDWTRTSGSLVYNLQGDVI